MRFYTLVLLFLSFSLHAQSSLFDTLYASDAPLQIELDTDWKKLLRAKRSKAFQPLILKIKQGETTLELPGKVRPRGNMRLRVCHYPSLKIKLKKEALKAAGFSDLNDLKVVMQCSSGDVGKGYHRRERLTYALHTIYSDHFHRIVPTAIVKAGKKELTLDAFFVEDEEQLAARYNGQIVQTRRISSQGLNRKAYVNMCLFNYLILNTDWAVYNLHNVEFVVPEGTMDIISIPYDFDYSGFVGTSYAVPFEALDIESVYEPKWMGKEVKPEELRAAAQEFLHHEEEAIALVKEYPDLHKVQRRRLLQRLESFFDLLRNEKQLMHLLKD